MLFDNDDLDFAFFAGLNNNQNNSSKVLSAKDGFLRGNMFKDEYKPYRNLTYIDIRPKNDREAKLYTVMQYSFAVNDLNLYLDLHPDDSSMFNTFKEMVKEEKIAKKEYEELYGPLTVTHTLGNNFDWIDSPWSWEDLGGNMYV